MPFSLDGIETKRNWRTRTWSIEIGEPANPRRPTAFAVGILLVYLAISIVYVSRGSTVSSGESVVVFVCFVVTMLLFVALACGNLRWSRVRAAGSQGRLLTAVAVAVLNLVIDVVAAPRLPDQSATALAVAVVESASYLLVILAVFALDCLYTRPVRPVAVSWVLAVILLIAYNFFTALLGARSDAPILTIGSATITRLNAQRSVFSMHASLLVDGFLVAARDSTHSTCYFFRLPSEQAPSVSRSDPMGFETSVRRALTAVSVAAVLSVLLFSVGHVVLGTPVWYPFAQFLIAATLFGGIAGASNGNFDPTEVRQTYLQPRIILLLFLSTANAVADVTANAITGPPHFVAAAVVDTLTLNGCIALLPLLDILHVRGSRRRHLALLTLLFLALCFGVLLDLLAISPSVTLLTVGGLELTTRAIALAALSTQLITVTGAFIGTALDSEARFRHFLDRRPLPHDASDSLIDGSSEPVDPNWTRRPTLRGSISVNFNPVLHASPGTRSTAEVLKELRKSRRSMERRRRVVTGPRRHIADSACKHDEAARKERDPESGSSGSGSDP